MQRTAQNGYLEELEAFAEQSFGESPFADPHMHEQSESLEEATEFLSSNWEFQTPFLSGESSEAGQQESLAPEVATFSEMVAELKDTLFRESLEQLADEAMEANSAQMAGEFGDRETRDAHAERLLHEHLMPLSAQAEAMLDRFFERLEGYEAESLTDTEIERISGEVLPSETMMSPASEQFLGGLLRKAGRLVSGAVRLAKRGVEGAINLAGKGLSAIGKLALGALLKPLKLLGSFLLKHVVKFALGQLPPTLRPLAQKLSERLFRALGETSESEEHEEHEQYEAEVLPAGEDAARLEAEFDVQVAQLLVTPDEAEVEHLVASYGETENLSSPMAALDDARGQFVKELARLQPGESAGPMMEQFVPAALWPVAKTAITILGRPKLVAFLGKLLSGLVKPLIGADAAGLLAPAIADAGLRIFGLETGHADPRMVAAEALAATVEETLHVVSGMPPHILENETLLSEAVHEAFESAAASYFPNSIIKPELRESAERHGMWSRVPVRGGRRRYAKYSDAMPIEISPRMASTIDTFGSGNLNDHMRDQYGANNGQPYRANVTLYQALPGTRGSTIAGAEGFPASQLHPLTPQAAGALLGPSAMLGARTVPPAYMATPQKLFVNQRLYRIAPASGRHRHVRPVHAELLINLPRNEVRLWLYLSEPLCQQISAQLSRNSGVSVPLGRLRSLLIRTTDALKTAIMHRTLPPRIIVVSETPNLTNRTPHWLRHAGQHLGAKIGEWAHVQIAQYFRNNAAEFKRACASSRDGVTLSLSMTRVPGLHALLLASRGQLVGHPFRAGWPTGSPTFHVTQRAGYSINRLRA